MRVITGTARGRKLETLTGEEVRPTTDRIKEAVFSIIQFRIEGRRFLDLFSGSGQMGIEALSRGALKVFFVDARKESIDVIRRNLKSTNLEKNSAVLNTDSISFLLKENELFDVAFLDPPYGMGLLQKALPLTAKSMDKSGVIICEHPVEEVVQKEVEDFILSKQYKYGKIMISVYCNKDVEE